MTNNRNETKLLHALTRVLDAEGVLTNPARRLPHLTEAESAEIVGFVHSLHEHVPPVDLKAMVTVPFLDR